MLNNPSSLPYPDPAYIEKDQLLQFYPMQQILWYVLYLAFLYFTHSMHFFEIEIDIAIEVLVKSLIELVIPT